MIIGILASAIRKILTNPGSSLDAQWDKVVALLHLDGNAKDEKGMTYATAGTVNWVDGASGFGKAMSLPPADGASGVVAAAASTSTQVFGTGDFTVEMFFTATTGQNTGMALAAHFDVTQSDWGWELYMDDKGQLFWYVFTPGTGGAYLIEGTTNWRDGVRHHVAVTRAAGTLRMFVDGTQVGQRGDDRSYGGADQVKLSLGHQAQGNGRYPFAGVIDEFRATKMARYTANFTPATAPFPGVIVPVTPPTVVTQPDPYWSKVIALLHADSATVTDSGPSKRVVSGTLPMAPKSKFGAGAFDLTKSSSGKFTIAGDGALGMQGDVTTEFWMYMPAATSENLIYFQQSKGASYSINYYLRSNGYLAAYTPDQGPFVQVDMAQYIGAWVHVAITRTIAADTGYETHTIFLNGKKVASGGFPPASSGNGTLSQLYVGATGSASQVSAAAAVYLDEIRVTQAVRYTADFAVPTSPYPETSPSTPADPFWDKVTVLAHLDGSLVNKGNNGKTFSSSTGNPTFTTSKKKFGAAAAQPGSTERMQMDGLNIPAAFTLEAWVCFPTAPTSTVYPLSLYAGQYIWANVTGGGAGVVLGFQVFGSGLSVSEPVKLGQFYHVALCRDEQFNITLYFDGKPQGTVRNAYTGSGIYALTGNSDSIGPQPSDMIVDEFRFTEAARYAGTFTPPTSAYPESGIPLVNTADPYWANVKSLMPLDADFVDRASAPPLWDTTGTPVISTDQLLFGKPTLKLDGASALISGQTGNVSGIIGDNAYTVEAWIYPTRRGSGTDGDYQRFVSLEKDGSAVMNLMRTNGATLQMVVDSSTQSGFMNLTQEPTYNAWNHVALTRKDNQVRFFLNGKLLATNSVNGAMPAAPWTLGACVMPANGILKEFFTGYMGQFRLTVGVARYLTDFAVPTAAFPTAVPAPTDPYWRNVTMLAHFEGSQGQTSANNIASGSPFTFGSGAMVDASRKKLGSASLGLDGSANAYVQMASSATWDFGSLDFTIEMFAFWNGNTGGLISRRDGVAEGWAIQIESDGRIALRAKIGGTWNDSQVTSASAAVTRNVWTHVALTRKGSTWNIWLDGKKVATATITGAIEDTARPLRIGQATSITYNENPLSGNIDEVRITRGVARYTVEFTPPAAAFPERGPAARSTKVTTGRQFNGNEYLEGDSQQMLAKARTFFMDITPDAMPTDGKRQYVANPSYEAYGYPCLVLNTRSDNTYGRLGWYRRTAVNYGYQEASSLTADQIAGKRQRFLVVMTGGEITGNSGYSESTQGNIYLNNTLVSNQTALAPFSKVDKIGAPFYANSEPFKGTIRAIAYWDRTLTEAEINKLMTSDTYDLADFPDLSNAWVPENLVDGALGNSAVGGSPMLLKSV